MLTPAQELALALECEVRTSRSGGAGGQNVNKVETKVELIFHPNQSLVLKSNEKSLLIEKAGMEIRIVSDRFRSQLRNRGDALRKLITKINGLLKVQPKRLPTKPTKASQARNRRVKERKSEIKRNRRRLD
jgi:ribosome-associated protein